MDGPQREIEACRLYQQEGLSCREIARALGGGRKGIAAILERNGIRRDRGRTWPEARRASLRRHSCDHSFFDSIDTEAKAYWLGFLAADGCVTGSMLKVALSRKDREHLLRLKDALQATQPVTEYQKKLRESETIASGPMSRLEITSPRLGAALSTHGVVPRKTCIMRWPTSLSGDFLRHYLRGYSDGDGWFNIFYSTYVRKSDGRRRHILNWGIVATPEFSVGAQGFLMDTLGFKPTKLACDPKSSHIRKLRYGGNKQVARLWHLLYDDATLYLPRKREVAAPYI